MYKNIHLTKQSEIKLKPNVWDVVKIIIENIWIFDSVSRKYSETCLNRTPLR